MLNRVALANFKCFRKQSVALAPLTLLTGVNGTGKSSVMQALLALRQSQIHGVLDSELQLSGRLVNLGTADDVFYENAENDDLSIELAGTELEGSKLEGSEASGSERQWLKNFVFCLDEGSKKLRRSQDAKGDGFSDKDSCSLFSRTFTYLQAERIGPRTSQSFPDPVQRAYNAIGNAGEFCAYLLSKNEDSEVPCGALCLRQQKETLTNIRSQIEFWLSGVGQSARLTLQEYPAMDLLSLCFSFVTNGIPSRPYRPTHVGFGLSYVLPIFVAVLSSKPGSLLQIENPEAHLHPKGQSVMGHFLSIAASCGMQILVETHSDHLLNGVRLAVKRGVIAPEWTAINFFSRNDDTDEPEVVNPKIDADGRLNDWPDDFFDEWEKNLMELL
jgi:predicted ATPase